MNSPGSLTRCKLYRLDEVLPFVDFTSHRHRNRKRDQTRREFGGKFVWMTSQRLQTFSLKGTKCCICGIQGMYFALEQHLNQNSIESPDAWHFNLYALDENNVEILMTRDHIIPRSHGGKDSLKNLQTMCSKCNHQKGNKLEQEEKLI